MPRGTVRLLFYIDAGGDPVSVVQWPEGSPPIPAVGSTVFVSEDGGDGEYVVVSIAYKYRSKSCDVGIVIERIEQSDREGGAKEP